MEKYNERLGRQVRSVEDDALELLQAYPWPGNIRELENVIERTLLFMDGDRIEARDIPEPVRRREGGGERPQADVAYQVGELEAGGSASMKDIVKHAAQELERDLIVKALEATAGNVTQAARRLKISRKSLQLKMKDLGLREPPTEP